jgi:hypothetical protein
LASQYHFIALQTRSLVSKKQYADARAIQRDYPGEYQFSRSYDTLEDLIDAMRLEWDISTDEADEIRTFATSDEEVLDVTG